MSKCPLQKTQNGILENCPQISLFCYIISFRYYYIYFPFHACEIFCTCISVDYSMFTNEY